MKNTITKLLLENTGVACMDSGGDSGRQWQQIREKIKVKGEPTAADLTRAVKFFEREPVATFEASDWNHKPEEEKEIKEWEILPTVSVFHSMIHALELDDLCRKFNALKCKEWDTDVAYGISKKQEDWLTKNGLYFEQTWNTYNGESVLSSVLQGCNLTREENTSNFEFPDYQLIQIHGGADVRGGYTDAKLFKTVEDSTIEPMISANWKDESYSTAYDGVRMQTDEGNDPKGKLADILKAFAETATIS